MTNQQTCPSCGSQADSVLEIYEDSCTWCGPVVVGPGLESLPTPAGSKGNGVSVDLTPPFPRVAGGVEPVTTAKLVEGLNTPKDWDEQAAEDMWDSPFEYADLVKALRDAYARGRSDGASIAKTIDGLPGAFMGMMEKQDAELADLKNQLAAAVGDNEKKGRCIGLLVNCLHLVKAQAPGAMSRVDLCLNFGYAQAAESWRAEVRADAESAARQQAIRECVEVLTTLFDVPRLQIGPPAYWPEMEIPYDVRQSFKYPFIRALQALLPTEEDAK